MLVSIIYRLLRVSGGGVGIDLYIGYSVLVMEFAEPIVPLNSGEYYI